MSLGAKIVTSLWAANFPATVASVSAPMHRTAWCVGKFAALFGRRATRSDTIVCTEIESARHERNASGLAKTGGRGTVGVLIVLLLRSALRDGREPRPLIELMFILNKSSLYVKQVAHFYFWSIAATRCRAGSCVAKIIFPRFTKHG